MVKTLNSTTRRRIVSELLSWIPALLVAVGATLLCEQRFGLTVWQTCLITFALGGATYWGITSPLVDRYVTWSIMREFSATRDNDN